jgi:hypothetical protein
MTTVTDSDSEVSNIPLAKDQGSRVEEAQIAKLLSNRPTSHFPKTDNPFVPVSH